MLKQRFIDDMLWTASVAQPVGLRNFEYSSYLSKVPLSLVYTWKQHGISSWAEGVFQLCDPAVYEDVLEEVLEGNSLIKASDVIVFGLSAFGRLMCWHQTLGTIDIDFPISKIILKNKPGHDLSDDMKEISLTGAIPSASRFYDDYGIFNQCKKKLGVLEENEVYGFVPALCLGGEPVLENAQRMNAPVHLAILAQMQPFSTYYYDASTFPGQFVLVE